MQSRVLSTLVRFHRGRESCVVCILYYCTECMVVPESVCVL